ncbi:MAG: YraN family protein [Pseudomonadota bacterium]
MSGERRKREARGRQAERWAALYLRCKGYRILHQRYRTPVGELDLIAVRGRALVFIEVKRRPRLEEALAAVTPRQRLRLARAAAYFIARHPAMASTETRFDLLALAPGRWPRHSVNIHVAGSD